MKKGIFIYIVAFLLILALTATPILANDRDVEVTVSPITVTGDNIQGGTATASGTVTITSTAEDTQSYGLDPTVVHANSEAGSSITAPDSSIVSSGTSTLSDADSNVGHWNWWWWTPPTTASADSSQVYSWSSTFFLDQVGDYTISQYGEAEANYLVHYWPAVYATMIEADGNFVLWKVVAPTPVKQIGQSIDDGWYNNGKFELRVGSNLANYSWKDVDANTLPRIEQTGTLSGYSLKVIIPEDTIVNSGGDKLYRLSIYKLADGRLLINPGTLTNAKFSKPIVVYEKQGDAWVEILNFTKLINSQPIP